jgi:hypothetical protein
MSFGPMEVVRITVVEYVNDNNNWNMEKLQIKKPVP